MKYDVIYHTNYDKFIREVNVKLMDGWVCLGGVNHDQGLFCQSLTLEDKQKEPLPSPKKETTVGATVKKRRGRPRKTTTQLTKNPAQ